MNVEETERDATKIRRRLQMDPSNDKANNHDSLACQFDPSTEDPEFYPPDESIAASPPLLRLIMSNDWILFLALLSFRSINALMIQTSFVPDEYWQSVEVAHNMAFG